MDPEHSMGSAMRACLAFLFSVFLSVPCSAQVTTSRLEGTVTDPQGGSSGTILIEFFLKAEFRQNAIDAAGAD
jgi:hypothetical protein